MNLTTMISDGAENRLSALAETLFRSSGVDGVYGRTGAYESVVDALAALISRYRAPEAEVFRFPPVMSRAMLEKQGYLKSFPNLVGCVSCLHGSEREIRDAVEKTHEGGSWTDGLVAADLVLSPAACYPVYPIAAARGVVAEGGLLFDVASDCFRHEPSKNIDRLQSFRMREYVRIGTEAQIQEFRSAWIDRAKGIADLLGLPYTVDVANDPFFGRVGSMMAALQIQQALKFELLIPVLSEEKSTACMSFNYHREHFGEVWGLRNARGDVLHTGCVAFGMDRLAVALFATHGAKVAMWPAAVRQALAL